MGEGGRANCKGMLVGLVVFLERMDLRASGRRLPSRQPWPQRGQYAATQLPAYLG